MNIIKLTIFLLLAALATSASAQGWTTVPADLRNSAAPLPVAIHLAQDTLLIGPEPNIGSTSNMYGLVGGLIVDALEAGQSKRARIEGAPLLQAIGKFDAVAPLMVGIERGVAESPWLRLVSQSTIRDGSIDAKNSLIDQVASPYLVDVDCRYNIGESFEAIYGQCTTRIADKRIAAAAPDARWKSSKLLLTRSVTVVIALDTSASTPPLPGCFGSQRRPVCRSKWMEHSAALARMKLTVALETLGRLAIKSIGLSPAEADTSSRDKAERVFLAFPSHMGWVLEGGDNIQQAGRKAGWGAAKEASLQTNSDGVTIINEVGNLYHKRTVSVP
jgi:hypothetical protein